MDWPTLLNWVMALAPVLLMLAIFEWLDVFHVIHIREIVLLLALGLLTGICSYPLSGRVLDTLPIGFSDYSRFAAPWIEEALKGAAVIGLFVFNRIGFKLDAAISGFAVGAGFSLFENCLYLADPRNAHYALGVWLVRGLGTAIMHGGTAALFAVIAHQFNERLERSQATRWRFHIGYFVPGYLAAVAIHTAFNQFPEQPMIAMLGALLLLPSALLVVFHFGEAEARRWLAAETVSHRAALAELRAGNFPDTASGRLVAALAAHADGRAAPALLREYLEVHTALVLRAEEVIGGGAKPCDTDHALLVRMQALRTELGRTALAAMAPLLPFSREELWELRELKARLHGR